MNEAQLGGEFRRVALIGNHLPRQCGIATFTADLADALSEQLPHAECLVLAMNDAGKHYEYPARVRFEIQQSDLSAYRRAADFLNVNGADVVCVQHEFGIFGGKAGANILSMLRQLRMPIVTTLHTVLRNPDRFQRSVFDELIELSSRLVVMSAGGASVLRDTYGVSQEKIDNIPHGIPQVPDSSRIKSLLGVSDRSVVLTFGLLSPDKGLEYVLDAFPAVLAKHPDALYIVLGATHPQVKEQHGEIYRLMLANRARRLGIDANVVFYDQFVTQGELVEFLAAADIYITPYLNPEQSTSGTLAYAVGAGKAVISTPYRYAQELLANGRGELVPFRDPAAIAHALNELLDHPERRAVAERAAHNTDMLWPRVAQAYITSFKRASAEHNDRARSAFRTGSVAKSLPELPEFDWAHVLRMTDGTGLLQHAIFSVPRYGDGYCLDDNARALLLTALVEDAGTEDRTTVRELASKYLAFVSHAFDAQSGYFRNMMSYSRAWLEERGSDDSHGRALWALGTVVGRASDPGRQSLAGDIFHRGLPGILTMTSPRAWAYCLLGIDEYLRAFQGDTRIQTVRTELAQRLLSLYRACSSSEWAWFEDSATYANARLSQALIVSGARLDDDEMAACGAQSLHWLVSIQSSSGGGYYSPVGSNGFYVRGETKAQFDQQPIEAASMVSACLALYRATGAQEWRNRAEWAFRWFLGDNDLQKLLYDPTTGGCLDGLHSDRVNDNQGAEATLSFLTALCEMRSLQASNSIRPTEVKFDR